MTTERDSAVARMQRRETQWVLEFGEFYSSGEKVSTKHFGLNSSSTLAKEKEKK